jgi:hypothetical protein
MTGSSTEQLENIGPLESMHRLVLREHGLVEQPSMTRHQHQANEKEANDMLWRIVARDRIASSRDKFSRCHDPRYLLPARTVTDRCISSMSCGQGQQLVLELPPLVAILKISVLAMDKQEGNHKW